MSQVDARILNVGLQLAMEWGEHWLQPIQSRLHARFPRLTPDELSRYDRVCRDAMTFGHEQVLCALTAANRNEAEARRLFTQALREKYPWIDDDNRARLHSQGCYYAWKDGAL
jgi:hypothetical protein